MRILADLPTGSSIAERAYRSGTLFTALHAKAGTMAGVALSRGTVEMRRAEGLDVMRGKCDQFDNDRTMIENLAHEPDYLVFSDRQVYSTPEQEISLAFPPTGRESTSMSRTRIGGAMCSAPISLCSVTTKRSIGSPTVAFST